MTQIDWHHLPPLSALRAFEATARLEGYSAAARALNVTPAAIAQQVRKLEKEVGAPLVRREGRGIILTDAGHRLAAPLREAFALIADGLEDLRRKEATRGVRVSTTQFFVDAVILPNLGDFWKRHPGIQVTFSPDGNRHPIDLDNFDICVRGRPGVTAWTGHVARTLLTSRIIVCAAPDLLTSADGDISRLPWLYDPNMADDLRDFVRKAGVDPEGIRIVDPGSAQLEIEAAVAGYGLSISTELVVRRQLASGALVEVDSALQETATYTAIHRKGPLSAPVQYFLDWLTEISSAQSTGSAESAPPT